ncbi:MAG: hypothetical protein MUE40_21185 [Anaerolineae bacterium]|nr:hypothetical protein [Anaerolineae bacterium]
MTATTRHIVLLWLAWALILIGFQRLADWRYQPDRPDEAVEWTGRETTRNAQRDKPYLMEPFLNQQVSWDSEFYLSIAVGGYDDPLVRQVEVPGGTYAMNYAFFPLYPTAIRVVAAPLSLLGLNAIATATLAGVLVSLAGTLAALLALVALLRDDLGEAGALRTAFYLLIFPTAFFLTAVFTEALFLGLILWCFVLLKRQQFVAAAVLALLATWTRATGILLLLPLLVAWGQSVGWPRLRQPATWDRQVWLRLACVAAPLLAYALWHLALGTPFHLVEDHWFGRSLTNFQRTLDGWYNAVDEILTNPLPVRRLYYVMEFSAAGVALVAGLLALRRYPGIALFCLAALAAGALTGAPQSLVRYVLTLPVVILLLGRLGQNALFDRAWTLTSLLFLGLQMYLFSQDMWVA